MVNKIPPRPQWNHPDVKASAVEHIVDEVFKWAIDNGVFNEYSSVDDREFLALLTVAVIETPDSYSCGRYLEDNHEWPTDGELIRLLDHAYLILNEKVREKTHEWVMRHNIRIPAKVGDIIDFTVDNGRTCYGKVVGTLGREAVVFVEVGKDNPQTKRVKFEQIIKITPESKHKKPPHLKLVDK